MLLHCHNHIQNINPVLGYIYVISMSLLLISVAALIVSLIIRHRKDPFEW